jgi:hypothetical protein
MGSLNFAFLLGNFGICIKHKKLVMLLFEGRIGCPQECRNQKSFSPELAGGELFCMGIIKFQSHNHTFSSQANSNPSYLFLYFGSNPSYLHEGRSSSIQALVAPMEFGGSEHSIFNSNCCQQWNIWLRAAVEVILVIL